jgi:hypothetical protein
LTREDATRRQAAIATELDRLEHLADQGFDVGAQVEKLCAEHAECEMIILATAPIDGARTADGIDASQGVDT